MEKLIIDSSIIENIITERNTEIDRDRQRETEKERL